VLTDLFVTVTLPEAASYVNVPAMCAFGRPPPVRSTVIVCVAATTFVVKVVAPPGFDAVQTPSNVQLGVAAASVLPATTPTNAATEIIEMSVRIERSIVDLRFREKRHFGPTSWFSRELSASRASQEGGIDLRVRLNPTLGYGPARRPKDGADLVIRRELE